MKLRNTLLFRMSEELDQLDSTTSTELTKWLMAVGAGNLLPYNIRGAMARLSPRAQIGTFYYYLLHEGIITEHISGFKYFNHYIKLPLSWLNEVHSTKDVTDEEGNITTIITLNKDVYRVKHSNNTHCLIQITDANFNELYKLIVFEDATPFGTVMNYPQNTVCSDKYFAAIAEGGEFYKQPILEDEI